jgi:hypothetical protein
VQLTKTTKTTKDPLSAFSKEQIKVLSTIISRATTARHWGKSYNNDRDILRILGYPDTISWDDCVAAYRRQDIAKAVINRPIQATWREDFRIDEEGDIQTPFEKAWETLYTEMKLKAFFVRLDKLTSLGTYACLFLGFNDVNSRDALVKPLVQGKVGQRKLLYVKPLGENLAKVHKLDTDPGSPRNGLPELYEVTFQDEDDQKLNSTHIDQSTKILVHHSRMLHITGETLQSEWRGEPILESIFNRLKDLEKLVGGSAEMFWRGARPGFFAEVDPNYEVNESTGSSLEKQASEYENNLRRILVGEGLKLSPLETQVVDPSKHVNVQIQMISAVTGIPQRVLTGSEVGELASVQDRDNWNDVIMSRRKEYAEDQIIRPFIAKCVEVGVLPKPTSPKFKVNWPDIYAPSAKARAEIGRTRAEALSRYTDNPYLMEELPFDAFMTYFLGLTEDEVAHIIEARKNRTDEDQELIDKILEEDIPGEPKEPSKEELAEE